MARVFDSKDKLVQNYQPPASYKEKFIQKINEKNAYSSARGSKTSSANVTAVEFSASRKSNQPENDKEASNLKIKIRQAMTKIETCNFEACLICCM